MWGRLELNATTAHALRERLARLTPQAPRKWGKLSPASMMAHVTMAFDVSLGTVPVKDLSNFFTRNIIFPMVFKYIPIPRDVPVPAEFMPEAGGDFETERQALLERMAKFLEALDTSPDRIALNPGFGPLTLRQWALVHGKHLDHHLCQFGL